jgi:hypothetical protein
VLEVFKGMGRKQALSSVEKGQLLAYKKENLSSREMQEGLTSLLSL